jgi:hypothetical protein
LMQTEQLTSSLRESDKKYDAILMQTEQRYGNLLSEYAKIASDLGASESRAQYILNRSVLEKFFFRVDGRPVRVLRRLLFHKSGKPRKLFRILILHKNGKPRRAFSYWLNNRQSDPSPQRASVFPAEPISPDTNQALILGQVVRDAPAAPIAPDTNQALILGQVVRDAPAARAAKQALSPHEQRLLRRLRSTI